MHNEIDQMKNHPSPLRQVGLNEFERLVDYSPIPGILQLLYPVFP